MALQIIGRRDKIDFPDLDLWNIESKIDTGAYTSSMHCHNITRTEYDGLEMVEFNLFDPTHIEYDEKKFCLPVFKIKLVKSSSGEAEERIFIRSRIIIFDRRIKITLSLTDRSEMRYPVLLGRKLLKNRFLVDCSQTNMSYMKKISKL